MRGRPDAIEAALLLADELEDDGYLRVPLAEVGDAPPADGRGRWPRGSRSCRPAIRPASAPASLRECLALQLRERDRLDPAMAALLDNLPLAARGDRPQLMALCGVDAEDLDDMLAEIRALDPKPGLRFGAARIEVAVPDVHVRRGADGGVDGRAQQRDAAAGARQQRLCRQDGRRRGGARLRLRVQRQRELAGPQPRAAGADHPQGRDRDRPAPGALLRGPAFRACGRSPSGRSPSASASTSRR